MFLFEEIKIELNSVVIEQVKNVGITTCIKNYLSISAAELEEASSFLWKDTY